MALKEKFRRGLNLLDSNKELKNLIGEEEDVKAAYKNIIKQKDESVNYFSKWSGDESDELKAISNNLRELNREHANVYASFVSSYGGYIDVLKTVLEKQEKVAAAEKKVKDSKKKGAAAVAESEKDRDKAQQELDSFKADNLKLCLLKLTQAYHDLYIEGMKVMAKQFQALGVQPPAFGAPVGNFPPGGQYPPPQGYPQQGQYPPQQGYPQQGQYPPQQGQYPPQLPGYDSNQAPVQQPPPGYDASQTPPAPEAQAQTPQEEKPQE